MCNNNSDIDRNAGRWHLVEQQYKCSDNGKFERGVFCIDRRNYEHSIHLRSVLCDDGGFGFCNTGCNKRH